MTSQINYLSINENYPVAGQDNDTQTLRDNFDTIKTSLRYAKEELEILQNTETGAALLSATENDFNLNVITNAIFKNVREKDHGGLGEGPISTDLTVDFQDGSYQIFKFALDVNVDFLNFPGDIDALPGGVGKATLELYGGTVAAPVTIRFNVENGAVFKCNGFPTPKNPATPGQQELELTSVNDPVIVEVWRHSNDVIYLKHVGKFE